MNQIFILGILLMFNHALIRFLVEWEWFWPFIWFLQMSTVPLRCQRKEGLATLKCGWLELSFQSYWHYVSMGLFYAGRKLQRNQEIKMILSQKKSWMKRSSVLISQLWSSVLSASLRLQSSTGWEIHCSILTIFRQQAFNAS